MTSILEILLAFFSSLWRCIFYVAVSDQDVYVVCVADVSMLVVCMI